MMTDETTTEQLAEIEGQATEYTPPDGWRVVRFGEQLLPGDVWVSHDGTEQRSHILHWGASAVSGGHCIRRIGPEPQPEPQPEKTITADDVAGEALAGVWDRAKAEQQISKLESLVADLRVINAAQEKAVNAAGRENADLQHRLDVVSKEWAEQAATCNGLQTQLEAVKAELVQVSRDRYTLQIELDAREQVPQAVSDRFEQGWDAGNARAVETIAEWTEPFRTCGSQGLSYHVMQNLPHIMRTLTGLTDND